MNVSYTVSFVKQLKRLPRTAQKFFLKQEAILRINWQDERLHLKKLKGQAKIFSMRITRTYRALFYFRPADSIILYAIGHRKDIYR